MSTSLDGTFALVVRFTVKEGSERHFDALAAATVEAVQQYEPGTLLYTCHLVEGAPRQRIFYELYTDRAAFDAHEEEPHIRHFLAARSDFLEDFEVDFLSPTVHATRKSTQ